LFDLRAKNNILVERFDINMRPDDPNPNPNPNNIEVWIVTAGGTWQGKEDDVSFWTRIARYENVSSAGDGVPTPLPPLPYPVPIAAGQVQGFYITGTLTANADNAQQIRDTNTTDPVGTVVSSDNHLEILVGQFETYPIGPGDGSEPTIWNGQVYYCAKTPQTDVMVPVN